MLNLETLRIFKSFFPNLNWISLQDFNQKQGKDIIKYS